MSNLLLPSPDWLGEAELNKKVKRPIPTKIALERLKAERQLYNEQFEMADQDELVDMEARVGNRMSHDKLIERVRRIAGYGVFTEDSIGYQDPLEKDPAKRNNGCNFYTMREGTKVCLRSPFKKGVMPEWTIIHLNDEDLPFDKTPGWREVLLNLVKSKALTFKQVLTEFGDPVVNNHYTRRWFQQTRIWR